MNDHCPAQWPSAAGRERGCPCFPVAPARGPAAGGWASVWSCRQSCVALRGRDGHLERHWPSLPGHPQRGRLPTTLVLLVRSCSLVLLAGHERDSKCDVAYETRADAGFVPARCVGGGCSPVLRNVGPPRQAAGSHQHATSGPNCGHADPVSTRLQSVANNDACACYAGIARLLLCISCKRSVLDDSLRQPDGKLSPAAFSPVSRAAAAQLQPSASGGDAAALPLPPAEPMTVFTLAWQHQPTAGVP